MELNQKNAAANAIKRTTNCRLAKRLAIKEEEIEDLLENLLYEPHLLRSEMTAPQITQCIGSRASISAELSDEESLRRNGQWLNKRKSTHVERSQDSDHQTSNTGNDS